MVRSQVRRKEVSEGLGVGEGMVEELFGRVKVRGWWKETQAVEAMGVCSMVNGVGIVNVVGAVWGDRVFCVCE